MPISSSRGQDQRRAVIAIVWMVATFAYLSVSAGTFTGLYRLIAEYQLRHFGSYRSTGSFIAPLFLLWLPVRWIAPKFWRRPMAQWSQERAVASPMTAAQGGPDAPPVTHAHPAPRRWRPWKVVLVTLGAVILGVGGIVGITIALAWKDITKPYLADITTIDLARNTPFRPDAYLVVIVGEAQPGYMLDITKSFRGSEDRKLFIPLTAPGWTPRQPIRVIRRERLSPNAPSPFGPGADRHVRTDTLRIDQDGVPGIVRAGLEEKGATLAPDAIVVYDRFD